MLPLRVPFSSRVGPWSAHPALQGFLILLLLLLIYFWKPIVTGQMLLASDLLYEIDPLWQPLAPPTFTAPSNAVLSDQVLMFYPWKKFALSQLSSGQMPLWNPYVNGGQPFLANGQSAIFDPFNLLTSWMSLESSLVTIAFLRLLCAGTFALLFALQLGMSKGAAFLTMLVFAFGGPQIVWLTFTKASVLCWLPALLYFSERLIRSGRALDVGLLAIVMAAQVAGGHPESSIFGVLVCLAYVGFRLYQTTKTGRAFPWQLGIKLVAAGILSVLLSAIHWLPLVVALRSSQALDHPSTIDWRTIFFQWQAWPTSLTMLLPDFFGSPIDNNYWYPYSNYNDQTFFAGVVPFAFAFLTLIIMVTPQWRRVLHARIRQQTAESIQASASANHRLGQIWFFVLLLLVTFALAIKFPVMTIIAELPGFNILNFPRLRGVYLLALALLAGYGLDLYLHGLNASIAGHTNQARQAITQSQLPVPRILAWVFVTIGVVTLLTTISTYLLVDLFQDRLVELAQQQTRIRYGNPFFFRPLSEYMTLAEVRVRQMLALFHPSNWKMYLPVFISILFLLGGRAISGAAHRTRVIAAIILLMTTGELWLFGINYNPTLAQNADLPTPDLVHYLHTNDTSLYRIVGVDLALLPNVSMLYELEDIRGYEPVVPKRYLELVSRLDGAVRVGDHLLYTHANAPFLDFLNVKYAFSATALDPKWKPIQQNGTVTLYENRQVMPRAFLVYEGKWVTTPEESLAMTLAPDFDFRQNVVIEGNRDSIEGISTEEAQVADSERLSGEQQVTVTNFQPGSLTVQINALAPAYLVLSETYTPGWTATVDGNVVPILIANHAFRAIQVPAGDHEVTLFYSPLSIRWGAWMSVIGAIVILLLLFLKRTRPVTEESFVKIGEA